LDCPVCNNAMVTFELSDVEVDHCTDCGGIWLDAGELELLIGDRQKAQLLLKSFQEKVKTPEKPRKCPICLKKMKKVLAGHCEKPLLIDKCRNGHGLWLDKGELRGILTAANLDKESKIQKLLAEIFQQ